MPLTRGIQSRHILRHQELNGSAGSYGDLVNGNRVSVYEDGKVLKLGGGDGFTTMGMCLMPPNRARNNGWNGKFEVY